jgi:hypothetical protein
MQNYDPYLNTYNYPYNTSGPYSLASDGDNQLPDFHDEYGGYDYPVCHMRMLTILRERSMLLKKEVRLRKKTYRGSPILFKDTEEMAIPSLRVECNQVLTPLRQKL